MSDDDRMDLDHAISHARNAARHPDRHGQSFAALLREIRRVREERDDAFATREELMVTTADLSQRLDAAEAEIERLREIEAAVRAWMVTPGRKMTIEDIGREHRRLQRVLAAAHASTEACSKCGTAFVDADHDEGA